MMLTAGFALPGFDGRLRAFRTYRPVADPTKPTGWKFVNDGTRCGRTSTAGRGWPAWPASPLIRTSRNIYTYVPNGAGGGSVVAFDTTNAATLEPHLRTTGAATTNLISFVRSQPLGAIIGSTPALMDPPSLDPPPDDDYGRTDAPATFAGAHKDRRAMIFFGANDGMIHAIDARTGYEVWAFIPYNLLPKLRTLPDGQPVEQFDYFVDSSPKIAEVKLNGAWRSIAADRSRARRHVLSGVRRDGSRHGRRSGGRRPGRRVIAARAIRHAGRIDRSSSGRSRTTRSFDPAYTATFTVTDGTPGGKLKLFGDLKATAELCGEDGRLHVVGPGRRSARLRTARPTPSSSARATSRTIEDSIPNRGVAAPKRRQRRCI